MPPLCLEAQIDIETIVADAKPNRSSEEFWKPCRLALLKYVENQALPPKIDVEKKTGNQQSHIQRKLRGDNGCFIRKTQNEIDKCDVESSLL